MTETAVFLSFAEALADSARQVSLSYFRQTLTIEKKSDDSPVTLADRQTEARLRDKINRQFPHHGIIGEEHANQATQCEYEWLIDPIDGTRSFITGYPLYGTLIALLKDGQPLLSIIDMPALDERFLATTTTPTLYQKGKQQQQVKTAKQSDIAKATLFSTDYEMFNAEEHQQLKALRQAVAMRRYNGDCYLYAMLASGWIDLVVEADMQVYDFLPLVLIVEQAGGVITDWQGRALNKNSSGQILAAATPTLHQAALSLIQP